MNLEQQCTSLSLSRQLKEAGVKQNSLFWWSVPVPERGTAPTEQEFLRKKCKPEIVSKKGVFGDKFDDVSAFLASELGELLTGHRIAYGRTLTNGWGCWFGDDEAFYDENEANSRAKMLLYLIQNKLI